MKQTCFVVACVAAAGCLAMKSEPPQGPRIEVNDSSDPNVKGADVWLDNESKGKAPVTLPTNSGRHLVELKKPGFATFSQWVAITDEHPRLVLVPGLLTNQQQLAAATASVRVPLVAPNSWQYETTSDNGPPAKKIVWEGGSEDFFGTPALFTESIVVTGNGTARLDERRYYKKTKDGLLYLGKRSDFEASDRSTYTHTVEDTTLAPPILSLPLPFHVGAEWTAKSTAKITTKASGANARETTVGSSVVSDGTNVATALESVTVPAGSFDCIVVRGTATARTSHEGALAANVTITKTVTTLWYAPKIGLVKSESASDIEFQVNGTTTSTRHQTTTIVLREAHITNASFEMDAVGLVAPVAPPPAPAPTPPVPALPTVPRVPTVPTVPAPAP